MKEKFSTQQLAMTTTTTYRAHENFKATGRRLRIKKDERKKIFDIFLVCRNFLVKTRQIDDFVAKFSDVRWTSLSFSGSLTASEFTSFVNEYYRQALMRISTSRTQL